MAIRDIVTRGYGNGTFSGTIALVTLRGYTSSDRATVDFTLRSRSIAFTLDDRDITLSLPSRDISFTLESKV